MAAALRGAAALVVVVALLAAGTAPAGAISEDELRDLRLQLQEALGELETATWDHRIAVDNIGLVQFEYDELALDAEAARRDREAARQDAADRSLALFTGRRNGSWSERHVADRYLQSALTADAIGLAEAGAELGDVEDGLAFLASELDAFTIAEAEAAVRKDAWHATVSQLDAEYVALAAAYEEELQFQATSTTTTTAPPPTTTLPPTTTTLAPTTTVPPTTTTTSTTTTTTTTTVPSTSTTSTTTAPSTTTTLPPESGDGSICPVQGPHHFRDTWGAPRSGGRTHQGVDMMADRGTPLVAIEAGTVGRLGDGGLGGITVWLLGDTGTHYYYAHLDTWAPGLAQGQRIDAGGSLGTVGSTGNAPDAWPHLHFEIHPDGGAAVNPYPTVSSICS